MSNFYHAYSLTRSWNLSDLRKAGDPDFQYEVIRKGSLTSQFAYAIKSPCFACQTRAFRYAQVGDSYLCFQPGGYTDHAALDEGLLLLTPRDYDKILMPLPSRQEVINVILAGDQKTCQPLEQPEFYGAPLDISGYAGGQLWNIWREV